MGLLAHPATKKNIDMFIARPSHGLLILGALKSGKGYLAKYIASKLLGVNIEKLPTYPFYKIIDCAKENAGIDDIRTLKIFTSLKTDGSKAIRRIAIIKNADALGHESQNAMLKMLEEPPDDTVFILTSKSAHGLKDTVNSRLSRIKVRPLKNIQTKQYLGDKPKSEIDKIATLSGGRPALLAALADEPRKSDIYVQIEESKRVLKMSRYERLIEADKLSKNKEYDIAGLLDSMARIYHAKLLSEINRADSDSPLLSIIHDKISQIKMAQILLKNNVQPKILLSELLYKL